MVSSAACQQLPEKAVDLAHVSSNQSVRRKGVVGTTTTRVPNHLGVFRHFSQSQHLDQLQSRNLHRHLHRFQTLLRHQTRLRHLKTSARCLLILGRAVVLVRTSSNLSARRLAAAGLRIITTMHLGAFSGDPNLHVPHLWRLGKVVDLAHKHRRGTVRRQAAAGFQSPSTLAHRGASSNSSHNQHLLQVRALSAICHWVPGKFVASRRPTRVLAKDRAAAGNLTAIIVVCHPVSISSSQLRNPHLSPNAKIYQRSPGGSVAPMTFSKENVRQQAAAGFRATTLRYLGASMPRCLLCQRQCPVGNVMSP